MKTLASIFGALAFGAFYMACCSSDSDPSRLPWSIVFFILSAIFKYLADEKVKTTRDNNANAIVRRVLNGEDPWYYLYLRPFAITNKVLLQNPSLASIQETFNPERNRDFETTLTAALEFAKIPLIALGKPGETLGAGRFATDDEHWREVFKPLASQASGLILVPSLHTGTMYEIKWIIENSALSKTIFVRLPKLPQVEWDAVATACRDIGLDLPEATDQRGALIKFSSTGRANRSVSLSSLHIPSFGHVITDLKKQEVDETGQVA
jgi:hypothetical protein